MYFGTDLANIRRQVLARKTQVVYEANIENELVFDEEEGVGGVGKSKKDKGRNEVEKILDKNSLTSAVQATNNQDKNVPPILILNPCELTNSESLDQFL